jgi:hypothetical protein
LTITDPFSNFHDNRPTLFVQRPSAEQRIQAELSSRLDIDPKRRMRENPD